MSNMTADTARNIDHAIELVRDAAARGAGLVLLPELFENLYWCQVQQERFFATASPVVGHPFLPRFAGLARELGVVLPVSFFERDGPVTFIPIHGTDEIADVTGAGDTVISAFTVALAAGASPADAARLANVAGGIVVMKRGTGTVTARELSESLGSDGPPRRH